MNFCRVGNANSVEVYIQNYNFHLKPSNFLLNLNNLSFKIPHERAPSDKTDLQQTCKESRNKLTTKAPFQMLKGDFSPFSYNYR